MFNDVQSFLQNVTAELSRLRDVVNQNDLRQQQACDQLRKDLEQERSESREQTNKFRYEFDEMVHTRVETVLDGIEEMEHSQKFKDRQQQHQLDSLEKEVATLRGSLGTVTGPWSKFKSKCQNREPLRNRSNTPGSAAKKGPRNIVAELARSQQNSAARQLHELVEKLRHRVKAAAIYVRGEDWSQVFREQDKDGSGQINFDEFLSMTRDELKISEAESRIRMVFESLDTDESGEVSIEELIEFVADPSQRMRSRLRQAAKNKGGSDWHSLFREQDRDGSGQLQYEEFYLMCRNVLKLLDKEVQIRSVFMELDADNSGEIDIAELVTWVEKGQGQK